MSHSLITLESFMKLMERQGQEWKDLVEMLYHRIPHHELVELAEEWNQGIQEDEDEEDHVEAEYEPNNSE